MTGAQRRIPDDGRRHRFAVEEILNHTSGIATINDVSSDDKIAGSFGRVGNAAEAGAGVQQNLATVKVLNLEQPDRNPGRLYVVI